MMGSAARADRILIAPGWRNWQTQRTQNPPRVTSWGFDPPSRHHIRSVLRASCSFRGVAKIERRAATPSIVVYKCCLQVPFARMITIEPPRGTGSQLGSELSRAGILRFLRLARAAVGLEGEVHVLLADNATLRRLNRQFRGKDKTTDVLSFPASTHSHFHAQKELAGDLAISLETAAKQAKRFGHTLGDEVRVLMLHGLLHLAGLDHEQDEGQMAAREAELRSELGLPGGLIERVSSRPKTKRKKPNTGRTSTRAARRPRHAPKPAGRKKAQA
jgi:probable rRNA maturation factor